MISIIDKTPDNCSGDMLVCFYSKNNGKIQSCGVEAVDAGLQPAWDSEDFQGKDEQSFLFYPSANDTLSVKRVLVVGLGEVKDDEIGLREQLRIAAGVAVKRACGLKVNELLVLLPTGLDLPADITAECLSEGLILGNYRFDKYKKFSQKEDPPTQVQIFSLLLNGLESEEVQKGSGRGWLAAQAACVARDMANEPGNGWTPQRFAEHGQSLAAEHGLLCQVIEKEQMQELGMGGILGVNQGSAEAPKLIILEYRSKDDNPTLMLVGKGLTFDSGGISLKKSAGMQDMKYDMCGGAAVMGAMEVIARERPAHLNVVALIPATDNMSGSSAIKPGDIITHYNGKTSEVINTDAEGRLILADALAYGVEHFSPDAVIDLATLTGAVISGLGHHRTGLLSTHDGLSTQI
ncbi:MAG: peptidase M17, partial [Desulfobulbaceae bacterium]|nr:peptidase M17 [Desulfobulbaceae bacterium]